MKKIWLGALLCGVMFSVNGMAKPNEETLDQIVAVVNDDVITTTELNKAINLTKMQIAQEQAPVPPKKELQKQVLDQLINKKLQLQIAKQVNINITDADLNRAINMIAEQNNVSVDMLYERLSSEGMSIATYRQEMRDQMTMQKLQQQEVVSHISVSPAEVERLMRRGAATANSNGPKEYHLEDVLIPLKEMPSSAEVAAGKQQAENIITQLKAGESVKTVIKTVKGAETNDLGWRPVSEIPSAFTDAIRDMQAKQVAGPIQTANGLHIIRLVASRALASDGKETGPTRKQVEDMLLQRKFEEAVRTWVSKLRGQAFIVTNASKSNYA